MGTATGFMTLKVQLKSLRIVRTIVVPNAMTLEDLNDAIQAVMGWEDAHLWSFDSGRNGVIYEFSSDDFNSFPSRRLTLDPSHVKLAKAFPARGSKLNYEYDFGDGWEHTVTRMADPKVAEIVCTKTEGPDGIEDIGGIWRLGDFLAAMEKNPDNPDYAELREWAGLEDDEDLRKFLRGPTAEEVTGRLREALAHVAVSAAPSAECPPMSEEEKAQALGMIFATLLNVEVWEVLERALANGGTCEFEDPENAIGSFFLTSFDGLKVKTGNGELFLNAPSRLTVFSEWVAWYKKYAAVWKDQRMVNDLMEDYASSAVHLYGVLTLAELRQLILRYDPAFCGDEAFVERCLQGRTVCPYTPYRVEGDLLIDDQIFSDEIQDVDRLIARLLSARKDRPRWYPASREELFNWSDGMYYEPFPEVDALTEVLQRVCPKDLQSELDNILHHCVLLCSQDIPAEICYETLDRYFNFELSGGPKRNLIEAIKRTKLLVRNPWYNGHKPVELQRMDASEGPKVSRNAPCPCGSGKKYKMCCGREK